MKLKEFLSGIPVRLSFKVNLLTLIALIWGVLMWPLFEFAHSRFFTENGMVENLQVVVLVAAMVISLKAKHDKKFFRLLAFIIMLMIMRETNLGRQFFCDRLLPEGEMCRWSKLKYGWIVELLRGMFGIWVIFYALRNKLYRSFIVYVKNAPIYVWDFLLMFVGAVVGTAAEVDGIYEILEECGEFLFYLALTDCLWWYSRQKINEI